MSDANVQVGYKNTEAGVIPEDWDIVSLSDIATFGGGTTPPRKFYERYYVGGSHAWVKTLDLNNSFIWDTEEQVTESAFNETSLKKHPAGTVLVAMYGGFNQIGRTGLLKIDAAMNQALVAVIPKLEKLIAEYLLYNLNYNVDYWKEVASSSRKDPNITSNDVKRYLLPIPSKQEQTAIATALSDVDNLIQSLERLISKKEAIKTATMQQLLTGKTRLPEFATREDGSQKGFKQTELGSIPEDWEVKKLADLADIDPENLSSETAKNYEFQYISLERINKGKLIGTDTYTFSNSPSRARRVLRHNDVLISTVRPNLLSHYIVRSSVPDLICSTGFCVVRSNRKTLVPEFLYQNLFASGINSQIDILITGSNYPAINNKDVKGFQLFSPRLEEQTAIATILCDMDAEIQALHGRLEKTKDIKQGMMQQLLTGKVRLVDSTNSQNNHLSADKGELLV